MTTDAVILHCDLNSFFASVEVRDNPELSGRAVAVCGSVEDRHGIVLAKTELAKRYGVTTGEAVWQAKSKCADLVVVEPHYEKYIHFSDEVKKIYCRYTDMVESFGIDECWLDVTGSSLLFGEGGEIADELRRTVRRETGLTISVGVSFNKIFAKLGSDMKKPDAVTCIPRAGFREKIWGLPACEMLGVGRSAARTLAKYGVMTIGQLAALDPGFCQRIFGKLGPVLWGAANGYVDAPVARFTDSTEIKSVGHGNTARRDMVSGDEIRLMLIELAQDVSRRLREARLAARKVQISIKNNELVSREAQCPLMLPTQSWRELAAAGYALFEKTYGWEKPVRALTVRAIDLIAEEQGYQTSLFFNQDERERTERRELAVESIRRRYGRGAINIAALFNQRAVPATPEVVFNSLPQSR